MPTYRFQCHSCGLNFQARADSSATSIKCDGCGEQALKDLPRTVNVAVNGATNEMGPTTTGFSSVDYNADRAIGEYSKHTWKKISDRQQDKLSVMAETGATGFDLTRTPDGNYRVMSQEERAASERSRNFHFNVMKHAPKPQKK